MADFPRTGYHLYPGNPIEKRLTGRLPIKYAWAFLKFRKEGVVQELLHQLKYNNHPEVGVALGKIFGNELRESGFGGEFDIIVPVPLHKTRKRRRGYNQSATFAEGLGISLGIPWCETALSRNQKTDTQTSKTKTERWENVRDVFNVSAEATAEKRVLLVDDVITTGATAEACGKEIVRGGCSSLSIACIAEAQ